MSSIDHHVQDTNFFPSEIYMMEHKAMFILGKIKIKQSGTHLHSSGHKAISKCFLLGRMILNCCAARLLVIPFLKPQADGYFKILNKLFISMNL